MSHNHDPKQNRLLAALPPVQLNKFKPYLEPVQLKAGDILAEPDKYPAYDYFPIDCTISLYYRMENGGTAEAALIGNEGFFSIAKILGGESMPYTASVTTPGAALRLNHNMLKQEFDQAHELRHIMLLYSQALLTQMVQIASCGRHHTLTQQLCAHLLVLQDNSLSDSFCLTQETIAHMLGMRREGVTRAARKLRAAGLIDYRHGHVLILDRAGLDAQSCECYGVIKKEFRRLLKY